LLQKFDTGGTQMMPKMSK